MALTTAQQEAKWKAEMDARSLKEAEAIKADASRLKAALVAAEDLEKQAQQEVKGFKVIQSNLS